MDLESKTMNSRFDPNILSDGAISQVSIRFNSVVLFIDSGFSVLIESDIAIVDKLTERRIEFGNYVLGSSALVSLLGETVESVRFGKDEELFIETSRATVVVGVKESAGESYQISDSENTLWVI